MAGRMVGVAFLTGMATLSVAGCSGPVRLGSKRMCEAVGGAYAGRTCNTGGSGGGRSGQQTCDAHGGTYLAALDVCEVTGTK